MKPTPDRLASNDPWITVEEARAQRRPIVARWLRMAFRRRPADPWRPRQIGRAAQAGRTGLLPMLPLGLGYILSYLFRNVNGVVGPDIMRDLGVGADALGLLTSVYFLTFAGSWSESDGSFRQIRTIIPTRLKIDARPGSGSD